MNKIDSIVLTSVHCVRVGVNCSSGGNEVYFPEQILDHRLTRDCQTERREVPADFLDKRGEIIAFAPAHHVAEFVLEQNGFEGLFLDILQ